MAREHPWGKGTIKHSYLVAVGSSKTLTVPAGKVWKILMAEAYLAPNATGGNRAIQVDITDGTNNVYTVAPSAAIAAGSNGGFRYGTGITISTTAFRKLTNTAQNVAVAISDSLPELYLPVGYTVKLWDSGAVDPAGDTLTTSVLYVEYDV